MLCIRMFSLYQNNIKTVRNRIQQQQPLYDDVFVQHVGIVLIPVSLYFSDDLLCYIQN